ncbi:beta-1,3-galactosyltransferase 2 [Oryzias melastigma]|uniref:beta-1,3-galactosyltransferase 2 n=1 Tax=Oryzias melastigma TaxID=30732 RepID=UPI00168CF4D7|nr:beta-1,3-galactosyltransferase 2 [Oryzias melastigma]
MVFLEPVLTAVGCRWGRLETRRTYKLHTERFQQGSEPGPSHQNQLEAFAVTRNIGSRSLSLCVFCSLIYHSNLSADRAHVTTTIPHDIYKTTGPPTGRPTALQYQQIHPRNYQFIIDNAEVCRNNPPFLVLMVPVEPDNVAARDAIRQTWSNSSMVQGKVVVTLFMLGLSPGTDMEKLQQENLQHRDLIQSNFIDTYSNLTIKTMVIMDWLATHCKDATFAAKIDSDMFLNVDNLIAMLQRPEIPKLSYLTGRLMHNRPVIRLNSSKWYVSEELYPDSHYPTYTLGMGYVFSMDLPGKFVEVSKSVKAFNIEDAYIGLCMKRLGLSPSSPPNLSQFQTYVTKCDRCDLSKCITYILSSSQELLDCWTEFKKPGPRC